MTLWKSLLFGACCAFVLLATAETEGRGKAVAAHRFGDDLFIAGGSLTVSQPVPGDLFAAGGSIDVDAAVAGDALALGGKLRLGTDIGRSVYAAAGQLTINGKVGRNVRVAGGQVDFGPQSVIAGNGSVAGGQLRLYGDVKGQLLATGGRILIDGPVGGDVVAAGARLRLGPNARIAGRLRYRSSEPLQQDPAATVAGGVELIPAPIARPGREVQAERARTRERAAGLLGGLWTLGLILLASVLLAALPGFSASVARTLRERPGLSLLVGFIGLVCLPVAALTLLMTVVGIPLALFTLAAFAALLPVGYVSAGIGLGDWALARRRPQSAARLWPRFAAAASMLIGLSLLGGIPWIGAWVCRLVLLWGLGALLLQVRRVVSPAGA